MKKKIGDLDAVPSKRIFLSIMADYDLEKSVCELIDNALDEWTKNGRKDDLRILVDIDLRQQSILIQDNAGGVPRDRLRVLVGPGSTGNAAEDHIIGLFGVGTKRAVVALAQDVVIRSRYLSKETCQIEFNDAWLADEDWHLVIYQVDPIEPGSTIIDLGRLRHHVDDQKVTRLRRRLGATYSSFISNPKCAIVLDGVPVAAEDFDTWSYPPGFVPRDYQTTITTHSGRVVQLQARAGLADESSPTTGDFGVFFYCNRRLVGRGVRSLDVGFVKGMAGAPHAANSLVKVIVRLEGAAADMPWNSSKSDVDFDHPTFLALQGWLMEVVKDWAKLSRNWVGAWPEKVFRYSTGETERIELTDFLEARRSYMPPMPVFRPRLQERLKDLNKKVFAEKPYARGLCEGVVAADLLTRGKLTEGNRIALIVLDSTLEIAFKDYLVHVAGGLSDAKLVELFSQRKNVHQAVAKSTNFSNAFWHKVEYYYKLRCKFVHEKATASISEDQIEDMRHQVQHALKKLFGVRFPE